MVDLFRNQLETYLRQKYKSGSIQNDPYELVKDFCIDGGTKACLEKKIPSVERKKEQLQRANETIKAAVKEKEDL
jgi:hypothetical protein